MKGIESHASLFLLFSAVEEVVERHPVCQNLRFVVEPCNISKLFMSAINSKHQCFTEPAEGAVVINDRAFFIEDGGGEAVLDSRCLRSTK